MLILLSSKTDQDEEYLPIKSLLFLFLWKPYVAPWQSPICFIYLFRIFPSSLSTQKALQVAKKTHRNSLSQVDQSLQNTHTNTQLKDLKMLSKALVKRTKFIWCLKGSKNSTSGTTEAH